MSEKDRNPFVGTPPEVAHQRTLDGIKEPTKADIKLAHEILATEGLTWPTDSDTSGGERYEFADKGIEALAVAVEKNGDRAVIDAFNAWVNYDSPDTKAEAATEYNPRRPDVSHTTGDDTLYPSTKEPAPEPVAWQWRHTAEEGSMSEDGWRSMPPGKFVEEFQQYDHYETRALFTKPPEQDARLREALEYADNHLLEKRILVRCKNTGTNLYLEVQQFFKLTRNALKPPTLLGKLHR